VKQGRFELRIGQMKGSKIAFVVAASSLQGKKYVLDALKHDKR